MKSVHKIINARKYRRLNWENLKAIGIAMSRAKYFMVCNSSNFESRDLEPERIKSMILQSSQSKYQKFYNQQLSLFN